MFRKFDKKKEKNVYLERICSAFYDSVRVYKFLFEITKQRACIAGGAMLYALRPEEYVLNDVDLFMLCDQPIQQYIMFHKLLQDIREVFPECVMRGHLTENAAETRRRHRLRRPAPHQLPIVPLPLPVAQQQQQQQPQQQQQTFEPIIDILLTPQDTVPLQVIGGWATNQYDPCGLRARATVDDLLTYHFSEDYVRCAFFNEHVHIKPECSQALETKIVSQCHGYKTYRLAKAIEKGMSVQWCGRSLSYPYYACAKEKATNIHHHHQQLQPSSSSLLLQNIDNNTFFHKPTDPTLTTTTTTTFSISNHDIVAKKPKQVFQLCFDKITPIQDIDPDVEEQRFQQDYFNGHVRARNLVVVGIYQNGTFAITDGTFISSSYNTYTLTPQQQQHIRQTRVAWVTTDIRINTSARPPFAYPEQHVFLIDATCPWSQLCQHVIIDHPMYLLNKINVSENCWLLKAVRVRIVAPSLTEEIMYEAAYINQKPHLVKTLRSDGFHPGRHVESVHAQLYVCGVMHPKLTHCVIPVLPFCDAFTTRVLNEYDCLDHVCSVLLEHYFFDKKKTTTATSSCVVNCTSPLPLLVLVCIVKRETTFRFRHILMNDDNKNSLFSQPPKTTSYSDAYISSTINENKI